MIISGTMPLIYVNIGTQISVLNAINGDSQSRFTSGGIYIPSEKKRKKAKRTTLIVRTKMRYGKDLINV